MIDVERVAHGSRAAQAEPEAPEAHAAGEPRSERMSRVDTAWLRMDNDVNLMMIIGVWLLTPAVGLQTLRERIKDKLLKYGRFRQKAVADPMGAMWVNDEGFDITRHVVSARLRRSKGQSERSATQATARTSTPRKTCRIGGADTTIATFMT